MLEGFPISVVHQSYLVAARNSFEFWPDFFNNLKVTLVINFLIAFKYLIIKLNRNFISYELAIMDRSPFVLV